MKRNLKIRIKDNRKICNINKYLCGSLLVLSLIFGTKLNSTVRYVKAGNTGVAPYTTWATAHGNLQTVMNFCIAGDTVWVAEGTYQQGIGVSFTMKEGVKIFGGFKGTETNINQRNWIINVTIIKGNGNSVIYNYNNGLTYATELDGFTVSNGNAVYGGGMYNRESSPTLSNIIFSNNLGSNFGGGMYNVNSSTVLNNVTFSKDTTSYNGGGMYNYNSSPVLNEVIFSENVSYSGGGMYNDHFSSPVLNNVTFFENTASVGGGGMHNSDNSSPTLSNVIFSENSSGNSGGGMFNDDNCSPMISNAIFSENSSSDSGGGMFNDGSSLNLTNVTFSSNVSSSGGGLYNFNSSPILINVSFSSNTAVNSGGGIFNVLSSPVCYDVTFSNNIATNYGGGLYNFNYSYPDLYNSVFWGNNPQCIYDDDYSFPTFTYCYTQTSQSGDGNIDGSQYGSKYGDPFANSSNPDGADNIWMNDDDGLHLKANSAAINAGNNDNIPSDITTDITGAPRIFQSTVDMGAYENQSPLAINLIRFTAEKSDNLVRIKWTTAAEKNHDYFVVQRSTDAASRDFIEIGRLEGRGDNTAITNYSLNDSHPVMGNNYYRLKSIDKSGIAEYSQIVLVHFDSDILDFKISPNPTNGNIKLNFFTKQRDTYHLDIYDNKGQLVFQQDYVSDIGVNEVSISPDNLSPGVYTIHFDDDFSHFVTKRLVITK